MASYAKKHIFIPAHMNDSGIIDKHVNIANIGKGYHKNIIDQLVPAAPLNFPWLYGCGDMYATTDDMYKFDTAIASHKILSPKSVKLMFTPTKHKYGFGFHTSGNDSYNHGVVSGWNTYNKFIRGQHTFIILFSNIDNGYPTDFYKNVVNMITPANTNNKK
jgi:CubicO group peptidase (beta-lactamase class C family)